MPITTNIKQKSEEADEIAELPVIPVQTEVVEIAGTVKIEDLIDLYPEVIDYLITEYGFFCVNCILAGYETLEEGAAMHGIKGADFEEMLGSINLLLNGELEYY